MAQNSRFFMELWSIFDIFHRLRPYLCSKRNDLGFHKQATHREPWWWALFLLWGRPFMTGDGPKMVHFGPKWPNMTTLQSSPKGLKRDPNGQPKCFWLFRTPLGPSGSFWTISNKKWYFAPKHLCKTLLCSELVRIFLRSLSRPWESLFQGWWLKKCKRSWAHLNVCLLIGWGFCSPNHSRGHFWADFRLGKQAMLWLVCTFLHCF